MFIYKISNDINKKVYIGQTIRPIEDRFKRHINDAINYILDTHFARAIRKYGKDHFQIELIDQAVTQDELNQKEQYWIKYYDSIHNGYNETDAIYKSGGNTYQSKSAEEMQEIEEKLRQTKIGENNPHARVIKCLNVHTNEELIFNTVKECQEYFEEKHHRFITTRVTKQTRSLYKNVWAIAYYENEYDLFNQKKRTRTHISVLDLLTNETLMFHTYSQAEKHYNFNRRELSKSTHVQGETFTIRNRYQITILN